jgi:hypothetical protein
MWRQCEICGLRFAGYEKLYDHKRTHMEWKKEMKQALEYVYRIKAKSKNKVQPVKRASRGANRLGA